MAIFKRKSKKEEEKKESSSKTISTSTTYSGPIKEGTSESLYRATGITATAGIGTFTSTPPTSTTTPTPTTPDTGIGGTKKTSSGKKVTTVQPELTGKKVTTVQPELTGKVEVIGDTGVEETKYYQEGKEVGRTFTRDGETFADVSGDKRTFTFGTGGKREVVELGAGGVKVSEYEMITGQQEDIRPPTQGELLATGGGIFLTPSEAVSFGITTSFVEGGTKGAGQRAIEFSESLMGATPGSSGVVFVGSEFISKPEKYTFGTFLGEQPLRDIGKGAAKFGVRVGTTTADILSLAGTQTLESGEDIKMFELPFGKTEAGLKERYPKFGEWIDKPTSGVGTATEIGLGVSTLVYGGYSGMKGFKLAKVEYGTSGAIAETAGLFSPLRPKSGIYTIPLTEETSFKAVSLVSDQGELQLRNIIGKGEGFTISSKQISKISPTGEIISGPSQTRIMQEATQIGGGKIQEGLIYSKAEGFQFSPIRTGKVSQVGIGDENFALSGEMFETYQPGITTSATRPKYSLFFKETKTGVEAFGEGYNTNLFKISRGAGVSKDINEALSQFGFGKRTSIPQQRIEGDIVIREPSGRYRFKPTITGYEINLKQLASMEQPSFKISTTGTGKKTPFSDTFGSQKLITQEIQKPIDKSLGTQLQNIQSSLSSVQKPAVSERVYTPTSAYYGTGQYERTTEFGGFKRPSITGGVINEYSIKPPSQRSFETTRILPGESFSMGRVLSQFQPEKITSIPRQTPFSISTPVESYRYKQVEIPITAQFQTQIPKQIRGFDFRWGYKARVAPPGFVIPPLFFPEGRGRTKTFERGFKWTPTFGAALGREFGISFDKMELGGMTGLFERPFKTGIKLPTII